MLGTDGRVRHGRRARRDPRASRRPRNSSRRSCTASWSGSTPSRKTIDRLASTFRRDYEIMPLVEAIVRDDAFVSDDAVRAKYRTPVEKLVGIVQATGADVRLGVSGHVPRSSGNLPRQSGDALRTMSYPSRSCRRTSVVTRRVRASSGRTASCTRSTCLQAVADAADRRTSPSTRCSRASGSTTSATSRTRSSPTSTTRRRGWRSSSPHRSTRSYERRATSAERP